MGDSIIRSTEDQWAKFASFLTDTFKSQYSTQQGLLSYLTGTLKSQIENPHGFSPQTLAALRGGATDNVTTQFESARKAAGSTAAGGMFNPEVGSGVAAQIKGQIGAGQAGEEAGALNNIALQDEQMKQNNFWKAISGLSGVTEMESPTAFGQLANGAAGTTGGLGSDYFSTDNSGFLDKLGSSFATTLGSTLAGGSGKLAMSKMPGGGN